MDYTTRSEHCSIEWHGTQHMMSIPMLYQVQNLENLQQGIVSGFGMKESSEHYESQAAMRLHS